MLRKKKAEREHEEDTARSTSPYSNPSRGLLTARSHARVWDHDICALLVQYIFADITMNSCICIETSE